MTVVNKSALVSYPAIDMYALVNDIESYPEFLPWCSATEVVSRTDTEVRARITFAKAGMHQSFSTLNRNDPGSHIDIELIEGPFSHLIGHWSFIPLGDHGSKIILDMDFEFSNVLARQVFGTVFSVFANTLVDSFCKRAEVLYGKR